ncbi:hypothetical protein BJ138DRAFT_935889 [Hygrophoropsis aurantiaca]|uniref:Uncharacterized protein n=1 Tax=Hygrophoropsis aurantiaca TaxID=72124 RepID=A0ACB8AF12_9AGAM|nr:hypothetical protein BJ138DRAFT_935889 [Hygrophoropsis aurantiaca]
MDAMYTGILDQPAPFTIGYALSFMLMGFLTLQICIFFSRRSEDPLWMKVFAIFSLDINTTLLPIVYPDMKVIWCFQWLAWLTGFVSSLAHGFFCWRIWALKHCYFIPVLVMMVSLLQFSMVAYGGITGGLVPTSMHLSGADVPLNFYIPIWLCGSLFCDMCITIYMTLVLRQERNNATFKITRSLSTRLIKLIVETGLITTIAALVELVLAIYYSSTLYHLAVFYTVSKLYANCVLANLNARQSLRNHAHTLAADRSFAPRNSSTIEMRPVDGPSYPFSAIQIFKHVETDVETDSGRMWSSS